MADDMSRAIDTLGARLDAALAEFAKEIEQQRALQDTMTLESAIDALKATVNAAKTGLTRVHDPDVLASLENDKYSFAFLQECAAQLLGNILELKKRTAPAALGAGPVMLLKVSTKAMQNLETDTRLSDEQRNTAETQRKDIERVTGDAERFAKDLANG